MQDREKVIRGLECLITNDVDCDGCPYINDGYCINAIAKDALKLLKEQEQEKNVYTWICPECDSKIILKAYKANKAIGMSFNRCPVCGKDVLYGKAD